MFQVAAITQERLGWTPERTARRFTIYQARAKRWRARLDDYPG